MLFGPNDNYLNAYKNLKNSWAFLLHDVGEPMPKWLKVFADSWQEYKARWLELEARTFSSASPEWTDVLAGLGSQIAELNAAIRTWKDAGKQTSAQLVDDSKLGIERASAVLSTATATVETAQEVKQAAAAVAQDAAAEISKAAPAVPWWLWVAGGGLVLGAGYLWLNPRTTVVKVER